MGQWLPLASVPGQWGLLSSNTRWSEKELLALAGVLEFKLTPMLTYCSTVGRSPEITESDTTKATTAAGLIMLYYHPFYLNYHRYPGTFWGSSPSKEFWIYVHFGCQMRLGSDQHWVLGLSC